MEKDLFASLAVVALFVAVWALSQEWVRSWSRTVRMVGAGLFMGLAAVTAMIMAVRFSSGVIFDLRSVVIGLAGFFAGPFAALIAGSLAAVYRLWLGGAGVFAGMLSIVIGIVSGSAAFLLRSRLRSFRGAMVSFAVVQAFVPLMALPLLPSDIQQQAFYQAFLPLIFLNFTASILSCISIETSRRRGFLTHILKSAIRQAPDYFYIKDRHSRFIMANAGVMAEFGAHDPDDLVGRTDFDFTNPERAEQLFDDEQRLLRTGTDMVDVEETVETHDRGTRTFLTTKTPIRNADGSVAGLVGFTKDLTERLVLERQLRDTEHELEMVLSGMSDGLARFDADNRLVFLNPNYRALFPLTGAARQPGASLSDILDEVIRTGEQLLGSAEPGEWKRSVLENMRSGGEEQVQLNDGRWLRIRSQPLAGNGAVVIVSDVTALKLAEAQLLTVAETFRVLATTDPLTGLQNRRDFDETLEREFTRTATPGGQLGLLLIDIDHFKNYNDFYGHPAGDACLRQVAGAIRSVSRHGIDLAARYGGEEFAVVLPGVDAETASDVAMRLLAAVEGLGLAHRNSPRGVLSVSIGVASRDRGSYRSAAAMLAAADSALYAAKDGGRAQMKRAS